MTTTHQAFHGDDLAVWPDGTIATLRDVWNGSYSQMSDDFERVSLEDAVRLQELGIDLDRDWPG